MRGSRRRRWRLSTPERRKSSAQQNMLVESLKEKMYLTTFLAGLIAVVNHATGPWKILGLADTLQIKCCFVSRIMLKTDETTILTLLETIVKSACKRRDNYGGIIKLGAKFLLVGN